MNKNTKLSLCIFSLMIFIFTCALTVSAAPIVLKFGGVETQKHKFYKVAEEFVKNVSDFTKGKLKIDLYFSGQLGDASELLEGIQVGTIDITVQASKIGRLDKTFEVFDLPYLFPNAKKAREVLDGPIGQEMAKRFTKKHIKLLAYWELGFRQITNNVKPIKEPADLNGVKLRTPNNKMRMASFKAFGASVTPISWKEVYMALKQGVVDGQESPLGSIWAKRFFEVQKYLSLSNHVFTPGYLLISEKSWKKIPKNLQGAVLKASAISKKRVRELADKEDSEYVDKLSSKGMKVNQVDVAAFQKIAKKIWAKEKKKFGDLPERIAK